jgi:integrase
VAQCVQRWLVDLAAGGRVAPVTVNSCRDTCERYVLPWLGDRPVAGLTSGEVQDWVRRLGTEPWQSSVAVLPASHPFHRGNEPDRLAPATVRKAWEMLRRVLNAAVADGVVPTNVAQLIEPPPRGCPRRSPIPPWTAEEALRFLDSARRDSDTLYPAYVLILLAGLRVSEALGLAWAEVDLAAGTARISHGLHTNGTTGTVLRPIRASARTPNPCGPIRLPDPCLVMLRHHRTLTDHAARRRRPPTSAPAETVDAAETAVGCGLVVTTVHGGPVSPASFRKRFRARCRRAGVRVVPPSLLGPTTPGLLVALHVPPPVVLGIIARRHLATPRQLAASLGRATQPYPPIRPRR